MLKITAFIVPLEAIFALYSIVFLQWFYANFIHTGFLLCHSNELSTTICRCLARLGQCKEKAQILPEIKGKASFIEA